jgi:hypothetical protein
LKNTIEFNSISSCNILTFRFKFAVFPTFTSRSFFHDLNVHQTKTGSCQRHGTRTDALNCPNVYTGATVTPIVTISDAGNGANTDCNPSNTATSPSNAFIALFRSDNINDDAYTNRYCVSTYNYNNHIINTMAFPDITNLNYSKTLQIWAGVRYNDNNNNPSAGNIISTLQLTVTYQ